MLAAVAATVVARSPVMRLFDISDVADGRSVHDHDALDDDEALAGHDVLTTSLTSTVADAAAVLDADRSVQLVENRFRLFKSSLGLRPIQSFTTARVRGHISSCVLAAVIRSMIGHRVVDADVRDPTCPIGPHHKPRVRPIPAGRP